MEKVRIGFIGAGSMANMVHYPSLAEMEDVEISAICDLNEERLHSTADKYGVEKRFTNYKEMIEKVPLDAVYIIMGAHLLYDLVIHALQAGLNVFIEKPPGITVHQIRTMAKLAERRGCITMVAFNRRFIPLLRKAREIVEERGTIIQAVATFYKDTKTGLSYYASPVDILTSDAIHCVDTLRWLGGRVKQVKSLVRSYHLDIPNAFNALMEFENGATGVLLANWALARRIHTFEIHARGVSAFINAPLEGKDLKAVIYQEDAEPIVLSGTEIAGEEFPKFYGYFQENRHFINCLKEKREPETSFADAVETMELVERIYQNSM